MFCRDWLQKFDVLIKIKLTSCGVYFDWLKYFRGIFYLWPIKFQLVSKIDCQILDDWLKKWMYLTAIKLAIFFRDRLIEIAIFIKDRFKKFKVLSNSFCWHSGFVFFYWSMEFAIIFRNQFATFTIRNFLSTNLRKTNVIIHIFQWAIDQIYNFAISLYSRNS